MRDALINRPRAWTPEVPASLFCLWDEKVPYTVTDPVTNTIHVTPAFEEFTSQESNWVINSRILETFPEIKGKVRAIMC